MSGFCFLLFRFLSVRCEAVVISQGSVLIFWSVEPFTTRPVFGFYLPVSSFFLVWCVRRRRVFSFSLSQALGNPKPFWFGVPLVFLQPGHALRPRSVRLPLHLHPGIAPHLFFFSFRRRRSFPVRCLLVLVLSVSVFLVGVFFSVSGLCFPLCVALQDRPRHF